MTNQTARWWRDGVTDAEEPGLRVLAVLLVIVLALGLGAGADSIFFGTT
jgi:hypothetical protein